MNFSFSEPINLVGLAAVLLQLALTVGVILRVMLTRHPPGSSFAWILLTTIVPYFGFILYLLFGERTLGRWHARKLRREMRKRRQIFRHIMHTEAITKKSSLRLLDDSDETMTLLVNDIDNAKELIAMEFYIWDIGGKADDVSAALIRAARRGVQCFVLVDAIGSSRFLSSDWARMFRYEGIHLESALPVSLFSALLSRADIRLHRKIAVIDYKIAYSGSLNMVDPHYFKKNSNIGQWVDAMVRAKGEIVSSLYHLIHFDWKVLTDSEIAFPEFKNDSIIDFDIPDQATVMIVPSGPGTTNDANQRLILEAIHQARKSIEIVSPYFIPGEALALALQNAALKGVKVTLILPKRSDAPMVSYAAQRYFDDLLKSGVRIMMYDKGMLHTKSVTVDGELSLFGTVNMDMRSMHLNYELMLLVFDEGFSQKVSALNASYAESSSEINLFQWYKRSVFVRMKEGASYLLSPLL